VGKPGTRISTLDDAFATDFGTALSTVFGAGFAGALAAGLGAGLAFGLTTVFEAGFALATTFGAGLAFGFTLGFVAALIFDVAPFTVLPLAFAFGFAFAFAVDNFNSPETSLFVVLWVFWETPETQKRVSVLKPLCEFNAIIFQPSGVVLK